MRVRSSGSLISTRPGRGVVTSARRDEGCDRRPLAAEAHRQRARGLARGEVTALHAVDRAVAVGFHPPRAVAGGGERPAKRSAARADQMRPVYTPTPKVAPRTVRMPTSTSSRAVPLELRPRAAIYIVSGALTPSSASPLAITCPTAVQRARRASISVRSSWITRWFL